MITHISLGSPYLACNKTAASLFRSWLDDTAHLCLFWGCCSREGEDRFQILNSNLRFFRDSAAIVLLFKSAFCRFSPWSSARILQTREGSLQTPFRWRYYPMLMTEYSQKHPILVRKHLLGRSWHLIYSLNCLAAVHFGFEILQKFPRVYLEFLPFISSGREWNLSVDVALKVSRACWRTSAFYLEVWALLQVIHCPCWIQWLCCVLLCTHLRSQTDCSVLKTHFLVCLEIHFKEA